MVEYITQYFATFDFVKFCDIAGFVLGLLYLWLEYKANIWLWLVSVVMPIIHGYAYLERGLYADFGMEAYYVLAAIYGYAMWCRRKSSGKPVLAITHAPARMLAIIGSATAVLWGIIYWALVTFTDSNVPLYDSFTTAVSIVALWALAQKYVEQWLLWLAVDAVCAVVYVYKQIPFTAVLYAFYTVMAVAGYFKWKKMAAQQAESAETA